MPCKIAVLNQKTDCNAIALRFKESVPSLQYVSVSCMHGKHGQAHVVAELGEESDSSDSSDDETEDSSSDGELNE